MARMLHTLTVTPPVTRTAHFRSRNCEFTSPHLVSCNRIFGGIITNSLLPRKLHSVNGRKIIRNSAISDQGNGGLDRDPQAATVANFLVSTKALLNFAANNALSVALIGAIVLGMANPTPGCIAHRYNVSTFSVFGMFIISGLTLGNEEIGEAAEAWPIALFGLASILLLTPLLSRIMVQLPLQPQEFATGLALYNCMPTAISSGVALTRIAGGNAALALMMTVTSSLLGVLIVPFSISKLVGGGVGASVPAGSLFRSLLVTLLIPLILGKVVRESVKGMADAIDSKRKLLSILGAFLLSLIPWTQVSTSRPLLLSVKPTLVLVAVVMGALLHFVLLGFNALNIQILCSLSGGSKSIFSKQENYRTLLMVASQKSITVLVAVVNQLGATFGASGLLVLPCIAAHLSQVVIDSFLVGYWNKKKVTAIQETVKPQKLIEPNQDGPFLPIQRTFSV
ncbi:probable sodium/metabolite cotransporter BASS4, chloroplastic [Cynara cardunculus var. scolymus]|uniref:probable sodium/metabolite cotransporter BASS4, chloroplastic n=1 Tax=Cynara cardunculus var. scolymus TaxID=59895 RepID=UPI000D627385|nr:probable sodium/metabolite cotransporter BASS4, chloroplastic [Cynara cardunculus var. scolymus]